MAEYIERIDAIKAVNKQNAFTMTRVALIDSLNSIPAADVAPVVRCRDCKWYKESRVLSPNKFCFRLNHPTEPGKIGYNFADDDFCSYGERKDGGEHVE